jgi:membrane-bound ClpP family serine protease
MRIFFLMLVFCFKLFAAFDAIHFSETQTNRVGHIVIDDRTTGISQSTWIYVKEALDYYKKERPIFIILELNTPGGEVFSAQTISDALKEMDTQYDVPVVAFINNWAISAGAMLAYSCRYIVTVKDGSMGAAEPILQGEGGKTETASEKINSAIRSDFANRAAFFDRNPYIAEAMVDKDLILVDRGGKIIKLDSDTEILSTDKVISPKGKLLTLTAKEMIEYHVADLMVMPSKTALLTAEEKASGDYPADRSLLFTAPFFKEIPNAVIDGYRMDWKGVFVSWLAHPMVQSILFLGLMLGFYLEISSPGFGVPGSIALTSLALIIVSSFAQETGSMLEVVLVLVGLAILAIDILVLPTFGLMGFIGLIFFAGGIFGLMLPGLKDFSFEFDTGSLNAAGELFFHRLTWLAGTFLVGLGLIACLAKWVVPHFKGLDRFVSKGDQEGWNTQETKEFFPAPGDFGIAFTPLRPSGKVEINENVYEAMTTGAFIPKGAKVKVLYREGNTLVVTPAEERKS